MGAIADHLWQSTWFALAAWLLALFVRKDAARIRYWVWLAASIKFLVPFAVLSWIGNHFIVQVQDQPALLPIVQEVAAPLATVAVAKLAQPLQTVLIAAWMLGGVVLFSRWFAGWLHGRRLVGRSTASDIPALVHVRYCDDLTTPVVIGGDHSVAIGTWSGVISNYQAQGEFGLLWIDAHMDAHTPVTSVQGKWGGHFHGMPLAHLLGHGDKDLCEIGSKKAKLKGRLR